MKPSTKRRSEVGDLELVIRAEWGTGPRTTAWDRLWRIILTGLDSRASADTGRQTGREGDDG
jgi:hypothetical protein